MIVGYDFLALAKMDGRMLAHEIKPNTAVGFLVGSFGDYRKNLKTLLDSGKVVAVRAHLSNGPCERNGNCEVGEIGPTDYKAMERRLIQLVRVLHKYPNVQLYVSPRLEHDVTNRKIVQKWLDIMSPFKGFATPVISAYKGHVPRGVLVEKHGNKVKADIISNDGESLWDAAPGWHGNAKTIAFGWIPECNGKRALQQPWIPPSRRPVTITADHIRRMNVKLGRI